MTKNNSANDTITKMRRFARECALQYIYQLDQQNEWIVSTQSLRIFWQQVEEQDNCNTKPVPEKTVEFTNNLIKGVVTHRKELDTQIELASSNWTMDRMSNVDKNVLRLATFELYHCDNIPGVATINEAVELAKYFGHKNSSRFVNGVLDKLFHQQQALNKEKS